MGIGLRAALELLRRHRWARVTTGVLSLVAVLPRHGCRCRGGHWFAGPLGVADTWDSVPRLGAMQGASGGRCDEVTASGHLTVADNEGPAPAFLGMARTGTGLRQA